MDDDGKQEPLFVVARGHRDLLAELQVDWGDRMRIIEDRRHDTTLLPREGRTFGGVRRWRRPTEVESPTPERSD